MATKTLLICDRCHVERFSANDDDGLHEVRLCPNGDHRSAGIDVCQECYSAVRQFVTQPIPTPIPEAGDVLADNDKRKKATR